MMVNGTPAACSSAARAELPEARITGGASARAACRSCRHPQHGSQAAAPRAVEAKVAAVR